MTTDLEHQCAALMAELGMDLPRSVQPLTGGVASDIAMIDLGHQKICAKFALAKLKVAEDWRAPVHRNRAEYAWLKTAAQITPDSSVSLLGHSETLNGFAMEYIAGDDVTLWKSELLAGRGIDDQAARVGDTLGRIHNAAAHPDFDATPFQNRDDFRALRIEPYLTFTATRHPHVAPALNRLADALYTSDQTLVHGDVSPKNILFRGDHPILLDAECATMGDASFDVGFCLNHLILKAIHLPASRTALLNRVAAFWAAYAPHISWEPQADLNARLCRLIPALMLARVDGKSPVEYLIEEQRQVTRAIALPLINEPPQTIAALTTHLTEELKRPAP